VSARVIDGKELAKQLNQALKPKAAALARPPGLAVVLVGQDPASEVYVRRKGEVAERLGFHHRQITLPADTSQARLVELIDELNGDDAVDGILVQLPLPKGIDSDAVVNRIHPDKDVDGFTDTNAGRLSRGRPQFVACTPKGVMRLLDHAGVKLEGVNAVVVGRSNIVGRPQAQLLEQANATVTICHSRTRDLAAVVGTADVLVVAIGKADLVKGAWIKPGAVVIDVGMNRNDEGKLCGDADFAGVKEVASWITPVPGGVGPMTITMLLVNTVEAAERAAG